jgi:hypothetical protein
MTAKEIDLGRNLLLRSSLWPYARSGGGLARLSGYALWYGTLASLIALAWIVIDNWPAGAKRLREPLLDKDGNPVVDCSAPVVARTCVVVDHPANRKYLKSLKR